MSFASARLCCSLLLAALALAACTAPAAPPAAPAHSPSGAQAPLSAQEPLSAQDARPRTGGAPASAPAVLSAAALSSQRAIEEVGASTRGSVVALDVGVPPREVTVFLQALSAERQAELAAIAPNLKLVLGLGRDQAVARAAEADAVEARYATPDFLAASKRVVWVQALSAGVDRYLEIPELRTRRGLVFTNLRGVHGPAIADHVFGMLLTLTRGLRERWQQQAEARWQRETLAVPVALAGRTLLVVGLGGIGSEVARRGHGFGMRVIGTRRSSTAAEPFVERVGRPEELRALLPEADVVVICAPLTPETEGLFDAASFAAIKRGAILVNIARGKIVDTAALLEALHSGQLAGACLDVTEPEPLPADHPLWKEPNVLITPHVAAEAELSGERGWIVLKENLRRFARGEPLLNVVDREAGY